MRGHPQLHLRTPHPLALRRLSCPPESGSVEKPPLSAPLGKCPTPRGLSGSGCGREKPGATPAPHPPLRPGEPSSEVHSPRAALGAKAPGQALISPRAGLTSLGRRCSHALVRGRLGAPCVAQPVPGDLFLR